MTAANRPANLHSPRLGGRPYGVTGRRLHQCFSASEEFREHIRVIVVNLYSPPDVLRASDGARGDFARAQRSWPHGYFLTPEEK